MYPAAPEWMMIYHDSIIWTQWKREGEKLYQGGTQFSDEYRFTDLWTDGDSKLCTANCHQFSQLAIDYISCITVRSSHSDDRDKPGRVSSDTKVTGSGFLIKQSAVFE